MTYLAEMETDAALAQHRIALGLRVERKVLTLGTAPAQSILPQSVDTCCANAHGFILHAGVRYAMNQRGKLERLCRYITLPTIAGDVHCKKMKFIGLSSGE